MANSKASHQMLEILSFSDREMALPPSTEISELTFVVKKSTMMLSYVSIFKNRRGNLKLNVVLVLESKASNNTHFETSETVRGKRVKGKR